MMVTRVCSYYPRAGHGDGGVTNSLWLWVESLRTAGVEVEVCHDDRLTVLPTRYYPHGVRLRAVHHVGRGRLTLPVDLLGRMKKEASVLLLHSGYVAFNLRASAQARSRGVPYVVTPHGAYDPHLRITRRPVRTLWELAERRMLEQALAVHVFFPAEAAHVRALAPAARVVTSPTAFPLPENAWTGTGATPYVCWVGRYDVRHKGLDRLLDAMETLPAEQRPQLRLHGRDSKQTRRDIEALADDRGLQDHVRVGPPVEGAEKRRLLLGSAAYVHPSRWEAYGVSLVEALAHGVPCITTTDVDLAGPLSAARAATVVVGSVEGLAAALADVAQGRLPQDLGVRARNFVRTALSHEVAGRQLVDQVDRLISERVAP